METFIHKFMECDGIPIQRTSKECMDYLQDVLGYSFEVARGYVVVSTYTPVKSYN